MQQTGLSLHEKISRNIHAVDKVADQLPGIVIIHDLKSSGVAYMSPNGLRLLSITMEELREMGADYHSRFFNPEDSKDYAPKIMGLLERNSDDTVTFFQQVRYHQHADWVWYVTNVKIFMKDDEGNPILAISTSFPVDTEHNITIKVSRLLQENGFLKSNIEKFTMLGKREREVLKYAAQGKNAAEIAGIMYISVTTVETHRRNIKQKLGANSAFELLQYAQAFNLV